MFTIVSILPYSLLLCMPVMVNESRILRWIFLLKTNFSSISDFSLFQKNKSCIHSSLGLVPQSEHQSMFSETWWIMEWNPNRKLKSWIFHRIQEVTNSISFSMCWIWIKILNSVQQNSIKSGLRFGVNGVLV